MLINFITAWFLYIVLPKGLLSVMLIFGIILFCSNFLELFCYMKNFLKINICFVDSQLICFVRINIYFVTESSFFQYGNKRILFVLLKPGAF